MRRLTIWAITFALLTSCSTEEEAERGEEWCAITAYESAEVSLCASTDGTRLNSDNEWDAGDSIGVSTTGLSYDYTNIEYLITDAGASSGLTPRLVRETIEYPFVDSDEMTFHLYYPYDADAGATATIDLDLSDQSKCIYDFLQQSVTTRYGYSESVSTPEISVCMEHKVARLVINIEFKDNINYDEDCGWHYLLLRNVLAQAEYSILSGEVVDFPTGYSDITPNYTSLDSKSGVITITLHPGSTCDNTYLAMSIADWDAEYRYYTVDLGLDSDSIKPGMFYTYNLTVGNDFVELSDYTINSWENREETKYSEDDSDPILDLTLQNN